ncbi:FtsX-like permease family protein [Actinosynnema sp. NPDC050436]|uniref:ABC transporter permease n=1 Tax=Actinosynnema sp. NPDC050436 TaxID=3155659 RepID=UPI0033C0EEBF
MSALGRVVRAGLGRRRVQAVVIGLAAMMAVTASVLGGSLLVASSAPFDTSFEEQRGAHVIARYSADAGPPEAAAPPEVTASAGPFPTATATPDAGAGVDRAPLVIAGRADPGGPVDAVAVTAGRWVAGPGEVVLATDGPGGERLLGREVRFAELDTALTVVGVARSVGRTAEAWVLPAVLAEPEGYQVLYRLAAADTAERVDAATAAIGAAGGGFTGARSWLVVRHEAVRETAVFVPFLAAFGVLGLVMSVLVVGNAVAGAVASGTRRIGVLKALGSTPAQVVWAYLAQALVPASAGTALGVGAGYLLAVPVLADAGEVFGTTARPVDPLVGVVVVAGALGVVAVTGLAAAWRAGRLRTADALAVGRTPRPGRGRRAGRLFARLPLPRPVGLGLARPFARPARALALVAAVVFGTAAVTFAVGLGATLAEVQSARQPDAADVAIGGGGPGGLAAPPTAAPQPGGQPPPVRRVDAGAVAAAVDAQPGTAGHYGVSRAKTSVPGVPGTVVGLGFSGDTSSSSYRLISGTWFHGPGEAVVPAPLLSATGTRVGDTITVEDRGRPVALRIVGEVFDTRNDGLQVLTDAASFPGLPPTSYHVTVRPGTDLDAYLAGLNAALGPLGSEARPGRSSGFSDMLFLIGGLTAILTLMLVVVAGLGVLNAVVLDTRERVRELGVHKALGMTPRQTMTAVVCSIVPPGVVGGAVGVPVGVALHGVIVPAMGDSAGTRLPAAAYAVFSPAALALFVVGGLLIAVLGALLPAGWAARTRTANALRAE